MTTMLPAQVSNLYLLELAPVQRLDSSGENCRYCQQDGSTVQVQAYAEPCEPGDPILVECCCGCLAWALSLADADMLERVFVEFETTNPVTVTA